ncbi:MAG: hypothetical protein ACKVQW_02490 [Pyrinomonadaceae bacterium]
MNNTEFRTGVIRPIECVKEGFELIQRDYWLLFAIGLVGGLLAGVTIYILAGAMISGIFIAYIKVIDGRPVVFDDLWKGMEHFGQGLVLILVMIVPAFVYYIFVYFTLIAAIVGGSAGGEAGMIGALVVIGVIDLIVLAVMVSFHTLLTFSFPLLVDRNLNAVDAMKTSARAVWQNLAGVAGMVVVNFGLMIAGYLALCIGLYFVIPIMIAANVVAYRKVFPPLAGRELNLAPPPPTSYNV